MMAVEDDAAIISNFDDSFINVGDLHELFSKSKTG